MSNKGSPIRASSCVAPTERSSERWTFRHCLGRDGLQRSASCVRCFTAFSLMLARRPGHRSDSNVSVSTIVPRGNVVEVQFTDGSRGVYDLVVGADGAYSKIRTLLWERSRSRASPVNPSGARACRGPPR